MRAALVCFQLALSLTLIAVAGVLTRSVTYLTTLDLGMNANNVVAFTVNTKLVGYNADRHRAFVKTVLERLEAIPSIDAVGSTSPPALTVNQFPKKMWPDDGSPAAAMALHSTVSGGYFRALGIPLVAGRPFTGEEYLRADKNAAGVAVINEALAAALFGNAPAIGRTIRVSDSRDDTVTRADEVIGVVGDTRTGSGFLTEHRPALYEPDHAVLVLDTFYVRGRAMPAETLANVRRVMHELEPGLPLTDAGTLVDEVTALFPDDIALARLMRLVALLATVLGAAGVYSVVTCTLGERTREFGIRMALGASSRDLTRLVLRGAGAMVLIGTAAGLAGFWAVSRMLTARLAGVSARDPLTLTMAACLLAIAAIAAAWVPARRATRIAPTSALKAD
jgi:predicted permease